MSRESSIMKQAVIETRQILSIMQPLLPEGHLFNFRTYPKTIYIDIKKDEDIVADANVTYSSVEGNDIKEAQFNNVSSLVGNKSGTILIYMHVYILLRLNIHNVKITNSTQDPVRASKGIYAMFEPDMRHQTRLSHATMDERLIHTNGEMRLRKMDLSIWMDYFTQLVSTFNTSHDFTWNTSAIPQIYSALRQNNVLKSHIKSRKKSSTAGRNKSGTASRKKSSTAGRNKSGTASRKNTQAMSRRTHRKKNITNRRMPKP